VNTMRWLPFALLATVVIVCQTTLVPRLMTIYSIWPEWVIILAVHYALWGPWPDAAIAAWILGLLVDLQSAAPDPIGLHAFCYGLAAWAVIRIRQVLFRDHPVTHALVTLAFAFAVHTLTGLYYWWKLSGALDTEGLWRPALLFAGYTAVWAPCLHWVLLKLQRWTGLGPSRRRLTYRPESPA
jgi:rod shape-determining protein MreD